MMKNILIVMEVMESWNAENKTPSNMKITLHGHMGTKEIGVKRILIDYAYRFNLKQNKKDKQ